MKCMTNGTNVEINKYNMQSIDFYLVNFKFCCKRYTK